MLLVNRFGSNIIPGILITDNIERSKEPPAARDPSPAVPFCIKTDGNPPSLDSLDCSVFQSIKKHYYESVNRVIESNDILALSDIYAQPLRLVFHDAGEVDLTNPYDFMGSDGCLSDDPGSKGLLETESLVYSLLDPLWQQYCDSISRADFWVLIGKFAVEKAALPDGNIKIPYYYGRKDNLGCSAGRGRLPDAQHGFEGRNGIDEVFVKRMGLTREDAGLIHFHTSYKNYYYSSYIYHFPIVTLSGAHTLGHVHLQNSGYGVEQNPVWVTVNAWDKSPAKFDNLYFKYLLEFVSKATS